MAGPTSDVLSAGQARRIALAAQGFARPRPKPGTTVDRRHLRRVLDHVGLIQIDSVNVLARTQEIVLWARLGPHRRDLISQHTKAKELFEYWAHEASHLPPERHALYRWRMDEARAGRGTWGGVSAIWRDRPDYVRQVLAEVAERGPLTTSMLSDPGEKVPGMWGRNPGKWALEFLFWSGQISATRGPQFERRYDLPERVLPAAALAAPTPTPDDAHRELLALAARHLGVATARDLADYYRLNVPRSRPLVDELAAAGVVRRVEVQGWRDPAFLHPDAHLPRWVRHRTVLSPFDSLVWERARTERIWDFHYRIEIYTPAAQRRHGYYVLPFLLGDDLVARVDLKADRQGGALLVQSAHGEPGIDEGHVAAELAAELADLAGWLGLSSVHVVGNGDLAPALQAAVAQT